MRQQKIPMRNVWVFYVLALCVSVSYVRLLSSGVYVLAYVRLLCVNVYVLAYARTSFVLWGS